MTKTLPSLRLLTVLALLANTALLAGCGSSEKVTRTTTEQTTTAQPPPVTTQTTTTTVKQSQP
jgi:uncharacterized lipoprotein YajG